MLFNSLAFLHFAILVLVLLFLLRKKELQHIMLLLASYFFYAYSAHSFVFLLLASTILDFHLGSLIHSCKIQARRKFYLLLSVGVNLGLLGIFKYANFFLDSIQSLLNVVGYTTTFPYLHIVLPVGISFYTFQTMSYTIDIYRGQLKPVDSILQFGLYVAFFPQLVAGPIVRAVDFLPQLKKKIHVTAESFKAGFTLILYGLIKKVIFADNIAILVNAYFENPGAYPGTLPVFLGALGFGVQIYCDFSGYSDIAIGIARIMGLEIKKNFDKPYFSTNPTLFWRKWHISLSTWLRDYLYIPLGGSRHGPIRTNINLMTTMVLGGLWHGASWNFLLWGFYQGALLIIHKTFRTLGLTKLIDTMRGGGKYFSLFVTQYFVFLGWLIFRISDTTHLFYAIKTYLFFDFTLGPFFTLLSQHTRPLFFLLMFILLHTYTFFHRTIVEDIMETDLVQWTLYVACGIIALFLLGATEASQFIYFQF